MSDPFLDEYYSLTKERFEYAKQAYKSSHESAGLAIEHKILQRFNLNDPMRSQATTAAVIGIRHHFKTFEGQLLNLELQVGFAVFQRNHVVSLYGLRSATTAMQVPSIIEPIATEPLQQLQQALHLIKAVQLGLAQTSTGMDEVRMRANLLVGGLYTAMSTALSGRVDLISAFGNEHLPVTALQAIKALRDLSVKQVTENLGEALTEAIKEIYPELAAEITQIGKIVRTYKSIVKAFGAHDIDVRSNTVEAVQILWEAMEKEAQSLKALELMANQIAQEITAVS